MMLKNTSIKRKLILINLITVGVALVLIATAAIVGQVQALRHSLLHDLHLQSKIIASNGAASLVFNDHKAATEILSALNTSPNIVYAAIYTPNGAEFAAYRRNGTGVRTLQDGMRKEENFASRERVGVTQPINLSGENVGAIFIESDLEQINSLVRHQALLVITVLLAVFGVVFLLLHKLQKGIVDPLLGLAQLMHRVSQDRSYSVRAKFSGRDEIGLLAGCFNDMLAQIEKHDGELERHRLELEQLVGQRTVQLEQELRERIRVEQELKHSNKELQLAATVLNTVDEAVLVTDQDNLIIMTNPAFSGITGYSPDEVLGKNPHMLSSGMQSPDFYGEMWKTLSAAGSWQGEIWNRRKNGELYVECLSIKQVCDNKGNATHYVAVFSDVTDRKQAEKKLRASNANLNAMLDNSPYLMWLKDTDGRFIKVNRPFFNTTGLKRIQDVLGRTDLDLWPEEMAEKYRADDAEVMSTRQQKLTEEMSVMENGEVHWVETFKAPILDENGQVLGTTGFARDITEHRQHIDGLRKAQELAEEIAAAKSNFLSNMSHEIRTPMNAIIGLSQLALNQPTPPGVRSYLEKIFNSSHSLLGILNDILDLSKIEARHMTIEHGNFDLDIVLGNLDDLFAVSAGDKHLDFRIEVSPDVPRGLVGDALRLKQVLSNLLGNAIKFTERGKVTLKISVQETGNRHGKATHNDASRHDRFPLLNPDGTTSHSTKPASVPVAGCLPPAGEGANESLRGPRSGGQATLLFSVEDTGIGIAKEDMPKLFQPFSQVDGSISRRFGGTGLGLAISHNLLQLMGSKFTVGSVSGKGSTFSFELVLGTNPDAIRSKITRGKDKWKAGSLSSELRGRGQPLAGARILVAEDDATNRQVVREFLELSGITVALAGNGKEALELLDKGRFDAVLMDVHMPVMNGVEAVRHIRAQPRFAHLTIIALTAGISGEERDTCLASGMNDFIAKPIQPEELIAKLLRWVKHGEETAMASGTGSPGTALPEHVPLQTESNPDLGNLPGFELGNILKMLKGNQQQLVELLRFFMDDWANVPIAVIETKAMAGDLRAAWELVHKLTGAAVNLGAMSLHAAARQLESELKAGRYDPAIFAAFHDEFNRTMSVIAGLRLPGEQVPDSRGSAGAPK